MEVVEAKEERGRTSDMKSVARLMNLRQAGQYLNVSYWIVRDWVLDGILPVVRLPGARLREKGGKVIARSTSHSMRKILVDCRDLDRLIEQSKGGV